MKELLFKLSDIFEIGFRITQVTHVQNNQDTIIMNTREYFNSLSLLGAGVEPVLEALEDER